MVRILVEAGANVDAKDVFGDPALHIAIAESDPELVRILVEAGANVHTTNRFGDSALSRAVHQGDREILQILAPMPETADIQSSTETKSKISENLPSARGKVTQYLQ